MLPAYDGVNFEIPQAKKKVRCLVSVVLKHINSLQAQFQITVGSMLPSVTIKVALDVPGTQGYNMRDSYF